ncbi:MAG: response regulator [Candidatus Falkowbacteria bacterium]|nr:response regulator [Candidatus Falkowbacteria bacterium]MDP2944015.1 response regulator [bacterium]
MENKKIFIIEDDANLLYGLESQFAADEFEVATATGAEELEELMETLRDFDPDFIILDLILPKIDGFEIIKKLKSDDELNDKQIFIFTDLSDEDSRQRSLQLGADYIFFKDELDTFEFAEKVKHIVAVSEKSVDRDYEE